KLWKYEHRLPEGIMPCCDVINRGAALYDNLVIFATLDAQLVALDQKTGDVVWKEKIDDYAAGYSYTAAPLIAGGLLLTGVSGGEFGIVGRVEARDPKTGKMVWIRPTVEGHMGYKFDKDGNKTEIGISGTTGKTWPGDMWKSGGAATWLGGTYDAKTGLAYFGTGNPGPWNSHLRPGDNLFSCATVAIDVKTGQIKWHYQTTPHDGWDFDGVNEFVTFDMDGKRVGGKADRNGFFYVIDAANGKLENAFPFVKKITWATGIDLKTGRPNYVPENRPGDPTAGADGKKGNSVFAAPSFLGGKNQMPMAYSPDTKLFYVPSNEWGMEIWNEPVTYKKGAAYLGAGFTIKTINDEYIGAMRAIDPKTGKTVWEVKNNAPLWGGVLTTAGNLVFWGTPEGFLKAADAKTGKVVWEFQTGSGVVAPPVTWQQDGEQYVSVVSGWGGAVPLWGGDVAKKVNFLEQGGTVWVFKLPK
ncbi:PQQ-dependent dehydrogenase, methanol/ethanol family, partial [Methylibium petroleiphilum]